MGNLAGLSLHEVLTTGTHGVTGNLVGTSDTQTLTNKTLTSPTITGATLTSSTIVQPATAQGVDGAITIAPGLHWITKAGVFAGTVAAPSSNDGVEMTFISTTDNAHTITFTGATLADGTTGLNALCTFAAFAGASLTVVAKGVLWYVKSNNLVTITVS